MNRQSGFSIYLILGLLVALGAVTSWGMWERGNRIGAQNEAIAYKNIVTQQTQTITGLTNLASNNADTLYQYGERNNEILQESARMGAELDSLRATEENKALEAPFDRGNSANERKRRILRRFTGSTDDPGTDETANTTGSDSS